MANLHSMTTSKRTSDFSFSFGIIYFKWTSGKWFGPSFSPISGAPEYFRFECEYKDTFCRTNLKHNLSFHVCLVHLNPKELQLDVSAYITLSKKRQVLFHESCDITRIQSTTTLIVYKPDDLKDQIFKEGILKAHLKLEGTLTFSGYELSTSVSVEPLAIQQPSGICADSELVKDFEAMYESGCFSDVTFTIGDEKLLAHKTILAARSPVFAEMFQHHLQENITNITIEHIFTKTFKNFLFFLYTGGVGDLTCESVISLYPLSKKYLVPSLQQFCVLSLSSVLTVDYACEVLLLADMYEDKELIEIVKTFLRENFWEIVVTTEWAELVTNYSELVKKVVDFVKPRVR